MNLQEDYCSSEIVKLLREKGFKCGATYSKGFVKEGDGFVGGLVRHEDKITHQMAMKWLREEKMIFISPFPTFKSSSTFKSKLHYNWRIDIKNCFGEELSGDYEYITYEEAVEAALKYCLTKLI